MSVTSSSISSGYRRWLIAAIVVVGCALRLWLLPNAAVEHFDEGVYASNVPFDPHQDFQYPQRHLYAPPLVPAVLTWAYGFSGGNPLSALIPSILVGCLTIVLVYLSAKSWFGTAVGMSAAVLVALSDVHVLYSRTALTDVWVTAFMVAAIWAGWAALSSGRLSLALLAGVLTGGGWWAKYNGWLPLLILLSGTLAWAVVERPGKRKIQRAASVWLTIAVTAAAVWSPVLLALQSQGGYQAVAANHSAYVVGFAGWLHSMQRQLANLSWFETLFTIASIPLAVLVGALVHAERPANAAKLAIGFRGLILLLCVFVSLRIGTTPVVVALSVSGLVSGYRRFRRPQQRLAIWVLAAWFFGLLLATPLYHPYPRLILPWLSSGWIAVGLLAYEPPTEKPQRGLLGLTLVLAGLALLAISYLVPAEKTSMPRPPFAAWQSRHGVRQVAGDIAVALRNREKGSDAQVVYVFGEPALFYHLRRAGVLSLPSSGLQDLNAVPRRVRAFFVIGPQAHQDAGFAGRLAAYRHRLTRVARLDYQPSDLVITNRYDIRKWAERPSEHFDLYEWRPGEMPSAQ